MHEVEGSVLKKPKTLKTYKQKFRSELMIDYDLKHRLVAQKRTQRRNHLRTGSKKKVVLENCASEK